jgi:hypothetical protein
MMSFSFTSIARTDERNDWEKNNYPEVISL